MKTIKALTMVLALILLVAPILIATPIGFSQNPVKFVANPVAVPPLTDVNALPDTLDAAASPSPIGQFFDVFVNLTGATTANVPAGVGGVEVHFDFSSLAGFAVPVSFIAELGQPGGVLNPPLLSGITAGFYKADGTTRITDPNQFNQATQYIDAEAATGGPWNGADGGIVVIRFKITAQPSQLLSQPDLHAALTFTTGTGAVDGSANQISVDLVPATVIIEAAGVEKPAKPDVFITPTSQTGGTHIGDLVTYTVMINASSFWDVAAFDITVNWDDSLIHFVSAELGGFLKQGGAETFGFNTSSPGSYNLVETKITNPTPSGGVDSLFTITFSVAKVGTSFPGQSSPITLSPVDLVSWAHPERTFSPWNSSITAVDLSPDPGFTVEGATYNEGILIAGAAIDLFDQYPDPYGGQGPFEHSDSFAPQAEVCLYAKVTFGGDKITNKLVLFEIDNAKGEKVSLLQNYTDQNGVATVCFRIPQTDLLTGPEDPSIFGWWNITSTVEVDQKVITDVMPFQVGWPVQIISVTPSSTSYEKYAGIPMNFTAVLKTIHEQPLNVTVSIDTYDVSGYPLVETTFTDTVNATRASSPFIGNDTTTTGGIYIYSDIEQPIPTWARVGPATVVGYTLTALPRDGGVPYAPQSPATIFGITYTPPV